MQEFSLKVEAKNQGTLIDMCGTGGDKLQTFNISTTASFVVAAAGGMVAKHGNRSSSGVSGSADIFEYFGYDLNSEPARIADILEVIYRIAHLRGISKEELEKIRIKKLEERGGFERNLFLIDTTKES